MEMWERDSFEQYYANRRAKEKANLAYFFAQKLCGIILLIITALCVYFVQDATIGIITIPLGFYLALTRNKVMDFDFKGKED